MTCMGGARKPRRRKQAADYSRVARRAGTLPACRKDQALRPVAVPCVRAGQADEHRPARVSVVNVGLARLAMRRSVMDVRMCAAFNAVRLPRVVVLGVLAAGIMGVQALHRVMLARKAVWDVRPDVDAHQGCGEGVSRFIVELEPNRVPELSLAVLIGLGPPTFAWAASTRARRCTLSSRSARPPHTPAAGAGRGRGAADDGSRPIALAGRQDAAERNSALCRTR